jgi:cytochrome P450
MDAGTVPESNTTIVELQIWGEDAQERWVEMAHASPVHPFGHGVIIAGAKAVDEVLHDPKRFSSNPRAIYLGSDTGLIPLQVDPPDHVRYRKMLDPLFAPRKMQALEERVAALVNRCIDDVIEAGRCDFSEAVAVPVPSGTFLELLGLPLSGLDEFLDLKDGMIRPPGATLQEQNLRRGDAGKTVFALFGEALDDRHRAPRDDLLSHFAVLESSGELSRVESLNICHLLLTAGLDTVTDTLECSLAFLARHPEHRRQLAEDPAVIPHAVEELLRYESPVPMIARVAEADTEVGGCPVRLDAPVSVLVASFNLDEGVFPEPFSVDFHRDAIGHIAFGAGVHRCLGSHLARMELRVVLREWHRRVPDYRLADGTVLKYSPSLREIRHLPLEFAPGRREAA